MLCLRTWSTPTANREFCERIIFARDLKKIKQQQQKNTKHDSQRNPEA